MIMSLFKMNHYDRLGLKKTCTLIELKKVYREKALIWHPDKNNGNDEKFKLIVESYEYITKRFERPQSEVVINEPDETHSPNWEDQINEASKRKRKYDEDCTKQEEELRKRYEKKTKISICIQVSPKGEQCERTGKMNIIDKKNICTHHTKILTDEWQKRNRFVIEVEVQNIDDCISFKNTSRLKLGDRLTYERKTVGFVSRVTNGEFDIFPFGISMSNKVWQNGNKLKVFTE
jgi:curved DNA-binding protein CbpA